MNISEGNQEKIVEAGGLTSLLMLLRTYDDETIRRIAAGAIANLAMNGIVDVCCVSIFVFTGTIFVVPLSFISSLALFLRVEL